MSESSKGGEESPRVDLSNFLTRATPASTPPLSPIVSVISGGRSSARPVTLRFLSTQVQASEEFRDSVVRAGGCTEFKYCSFVT